MGKIEAVLFRQQDEGVMRRPAHLRDGKGLEMRAEIGEGFEPTLPSAVRDHQGEALETWRLVNTAGDDPHLPERLKRPPEVPAPPKSSAPEATATATSSAPATRILSPLCNPSAAK